MLIYACSTKVGGYMSKTTSLVYAMASFSTGGLFLVNLITGGEAYVNMLLMTMTVLLIHLSKR